MLTIRNRALSIFTASLLFSSSLFGADDSHAKAQALLDEGRAQAALEVIGPVLARNKRDPRALLIRSTAKIMLGNVLSGFGDLELALEIDPLQRQGWLNLAGLEIAEGRFEEAKVALLEAQKLDPTASDNFLNLGAVEVLQGNIEDADLHFSQYLEATHNDAESHYQIACNYSLARQQDRALFHLERAIVANERVRMRARADNRFLLLNGLQLQAVLADDRYQPPADAYRTAAAFTVAYSQQDTKLLYAVLGSLQKLREPYDTSIETTAGWALIWGDFRIKLSNQKDGTGLVQVSATRDSMMESDWHRRTRALFATIHSRLASP